MKILVQYFFQNDKDKEINAFEGDFPEINDQKQIKVKHVFRQLPFLTPEKINQYHYRFKVYCEETSPSILAWIDIINPDARAPVIKNVITIKILRLSQGNLSRVFNPALIWEELDSTNTKQSPTYFASQKQFQNDDIMEMGVGSSEPHFPAQKQEVIVNNSSPVGDAPHKSKSYGDLLHDNLLDDGPNVQNNINKKVQENEPKKEAADSIEYIDLKNYVPKRTAEEKIEFMKEIWKQEADTQLGIDAARVKLGPKIEAWAFNKTVRNDLRTLLVTLHTVLWENSGWTPLSISDLIEDSQVKKHYYNAIRKVHPDKVSSEKDPNVLYIAKSVVHELNKAWDELRSKTNMQESKGVKSF